MILVVCPNPSVDTFLFLDDFVAGRGNRILKRKEFPGGKGVHVGFALNELGTKCNLLGFWGGATGDWLVQRCADVKIRTTGIRSVGESRSCFTLRIDDKKSIYEHTELLESGPEITRAEYNSFVEVYASLAEQASLICMSGSWPKNISEDAYFDLIAEAKRQGKRVILDASGAQLRNALAAEPYGIHLNKDEAKDLCGQTDPVKVIQYLKQFSDLIAYTMGKAGLYLGYDGRIIHGNVVLDHVFSSVGSGDCLTAGIAKALHEQRSIMEIVTLGVACGAANCLREDLGMLYRSDVIELEKTVVLTDMK